jgi:DNA-binding MarR family transcriptional regulator
MKDQSEGRRPRPARRGEPRIRPDARATAELFEQAVRFVYSLSFDGSLNPAQWNLLRFLAQVDESRRTPSAFASYHLVSRSTASQTVKAVVAKKLVTKTRDPGDGRGVRLDLTPEAQVLLRRDPLHHLAAAFAALSVEELRYAASIGQSVVLQLFKSHGGADTTVMTDDKNQSR